MKREYWEKFLIFLGVLFFLFEYSHGIHGDGTVRYDGLKHFLQTGTLQPMVYSYVGPILSSPLILLGKIFKDGFWWLSRFNTFLFLGFCFYMYRTLESVWTPSQRRFFVLMLMCGTMFSRHITDYYSETLTACFLTIGIFQFLKRRFVVGLVLVCLSAWNTPGTAIGASLVFFYFFVKERRFRYALGPIFIFSGIMLENILKFGHAMPTEYISAAVEKGVLPYAAGPGFSYPLFFGVLSVLFSFGKGLAFYSPGLWSFLSSKLWQEGHEFLRIGFMYFVGLVLVFSRWVVWSGDWFWGPRFYLFTSILAIFALCTLYFKVEKDLRIKIFCFFGFALSIWVSFQGITWGQDFLEACHKTPTGPDYGFLCYYVPEFSPLWRPFIVWPPLEGRKIAFFGFYLLVSVTLLWEPGKYLCALAFAKCKEFFQWCLPLGRWGI